MANASVSLPGLRPDSIRNPPLPIKHAGPFSTVDRSLAVVYRLDLPTMYARTHVITFRHEAKPIFRELDTAVGIQQVRLVLIDQVFDPAKIFHLPASRGYSSHL